MILLVGYCRFYQAIDIHFNVHVRRIETK
jgi:hypothetical protein